MRSKELEAPLSFDIFCQPSIFCKSTPTTNAVNKLVEWLQNNFTLPFLVRKIKDTIRSTVRIGFDGRVHKTFRGRIADQRFYNEIRILQYLAAQDCPFVPQVLEYRTAELYLVTSNCGPMVTKISPEKMTALFQELEETYGVRHDDPFERNITYHPQKHCFCVIDFELAEIIRPQSADTPCLSAARKGPDMSTAPPQHVFNPSRDHLE